MSVYTFRLAETMARANVIQEIVADVTPRRVDPVQESAAHLMCALHLLHMAGYDAEQVLTVALLPACVDVVVPAPNTH